MDYVLYYYYYYYYYWGLRLSFIKEIINNSEKVFIDIKTKNLPIYSYQFPLLLLLLLLLLGIKIVIHKRDY